MRYWKRSLSLLSAAALLVLSTGCGAASASPTAKTEPVTITVWNYYNGDQLESFNRLVDEFNETTGQEKGITVESYSQGSVDDLETNVLAAAEGKVGADPMPNICSSYADTAYTLDQMGQVEDLSGYLSEEERSEYIPNYLAEGDFSGDGSIKIFPVAKSTEVLFLNQTDWEPFAAATGATYDDLKTIEGVISTAEKYYNWTDSQTAQPNDGRALIGRDAMANYFLIGAKQLGCSIFQVENGKMVLNFDKDVIRQLWDNFYVPFLKGYVAASGKFRSDDVKTGTILGYIGSSSSSTFFPSQVVTDDSDAHDIERLVLPCPVFQNGENYAVQQGAGMIVTKASDAEVRASVEFLKWFTAPEHNIAFSVGSGYLPVTTAGNNMDAIRSSGLDLSSPMEQVLSTAVSTINSSSLYTTPAFPNALSARSILEYNLSDCAKADRAAVVDRMAQGQSFEEASAEFLSDDYFEAWYASTLPALQEFEG